MKITLNRLALPALLLLLSAATSCIYTDPNMGYGLIPGDQLLETKQMTTSLPVTLKMADSIATTSSTSIVFGSINSSVSGVSEYGCATVPSIWTPHWMSEPTEESRNFTSASPCAARNAWTKEAKISSRISMSTGW